MISGFSQVKLKKPKRTKKRKICPSCLQNRNLSSFLTASNRPTGVCKICRSENARHDRRERTTLTAIPMSTLIECEKCPLGAEKIPLRDYSSHLKSHNREFFEVPGVKPA